MNYLTMRTWRNNLLSAEATKQKKQAKQTRQKQQMAYTSRLHNLAMQNTDTKTRQHAVR
jgi:hypothetical protein